MVAAASTHSAMVLLQGAWESQESDHRADMDEPVECTGSPEQLSKRQVF